MNIQTIINALEKLAPAALQESYDNAGLIIGDRNSVCTGVLIALDVTEEIIDEALEKKCNLIVSHHPIIFRGLKKITGKDYVERTVVKAIKNDIALYAIHTNLDNVQAGVNKKLASVLGLEKCRILAPRPQTIKKIVTFVPKGHEDVVRESLFAAGAGKINDYLGCSFNVEGYGTFEPMDGANPFVGKIGERHHENETRIEMIFPAFQEAGVVRNLLKSHPYEEVAYYINTLDNTVGEFGSGMIGELPDGLPESAFLELVKSNLQAQVLRHTKFTGRLIKTVAICGGAGFFLLRSAKAAKADAYITADVKYHEFFDADNELMLVDAGHYETEQFTTDLLETYLKNYFPNFAVQKTGHSTNPIHYFK